MSEKAFDSAIDLLENKPDPIDHIEVNIQPKIHNSIFNHNEILVCAYEQKGDIEKAIAMYEKLTTFNPSSENKRLINPKNYYRLAKLYEQIGKNTEAVEKYERFLELWKDADPGLPEVDDAKLRLDKLLN